jgi:hypothetical protein
VLAVEGRSLQAIFGSPDNAKFCSSMTLFVLASEEGGLLGMALNAKPPVGQIFGEHEMTALTVVQFVARETNELVVRSELGAHRRNGRFLLHVDVRAKRMLFGSSFAEHARPHLIVAVQAELVGRSPHDQQVLLFRSMGRVADLTGEFARIGAHFRAGIDQCLRDRPGHSADGVGAELGPARFVLVAEMRTGATFVTRRKTARRKSAVN